MRIRIPLIDIIQKHNRKVLDEIDYITNYISESGNHIEKLQDNINQTLEELTKESPQFWQDIEQAHEEDLFQRNHFFPTLHFNSLFLLSYGFFESNLNQFCLKIKNYTNCKCPIDIEDKKSYIDRCNEYFTQCLKLDLSTLETLWELFSQYREIRNAIAHANSKMKNNKTFRLDPKLKSFITFKEDSEEFYINDDKFLFDFCARMKDYFNSLKKIINVAVRADQLPNTNTRITATS
ncbi:MAG: hypothetical protein ABIT08_08885 [Bacteroidia bacterium]